MIDEKNETLKYYMGYAEQYLGKSVEPSKAVDELYEIGHPVTIEVAQLIETELSKSESR